MDAYATNRAVPMSTISSASYSAMYRTPPNPKDMASRLMSKADSDGNGQVSLTEFTASAPTPQASSSSASSGPDLEKMFQEIDTDGDGSLTMSELTSHAQKMSDKMQPSLLSLQEESAGTSTAAPPSGTGGGASASASSDDSATTYDALDTNQDGRVSLAEMLAGQSQSGETDESSTTNGAQSLLDQFEAALASVSYSGQSSALNLTSSTLSALA